MPRLVDDSRGRHDLLAVLDTKNQTEIEAETGVSQPALSLIASRRRKPGRELATKLAKLGIAFSAWDEKPTAEQLRADRKRAAGAAA